jgi:hypothetical protein
MTTSSRFITRCAAAALAVGMSAALAGCGSAPAKGTADASSGGVSYSDKALPSDQVMSAAYAAAIKAKTAHIVMTMTGKTSMKAQGDVSYGAKQPSMAMTMSMAQLGKGQIEMRLVDGILYMQIPNVTPAGKFLAINPKDKNSPFGKTFSGMTDQLDPLKSIKTLESAVRSSERVGKQTIDGVELEHYKVTVDTAALLKQLGTGVAQPAGMPKTVTYDLWLDSKHLLHRTSFTLSGVSFQADMSKWGQPVHVQKPAAGQITSIPQRVQG